MTTDALLALFTETRQQRPPIYDCDAWQPWLAAIAQVIAANNKPERRWAMMVEIASDLILDIPGLRLELAFGCVNEAVNKASEMERRAG